MIAVQTTNSAEADDVYQELFIAIADKGLPRYVRSMRRYLYQTISNRLASRYRQYRRHERRIRVYTAESQLYQDHYDDPAKIAMRVDQSRQLFEIIEKYLPPREAKAITSRFDDDADTAETARIMGVDRRSVSRYVSVGLSKLRKMGVIREGAP